MRALVTGGAGFIGHHLVLGLLDRGDQVTVIDDFSSGIRTRLDPVLDRITLVEGSILDPVALDRAVAGVEVVFHEAALPSVVQSLTNPSMTNQVNVGGSIEVLRCAAAHGVGRLVFAGSCAVYGNPVHMPSIEGDPTQPTSPYGVSKLAAEHYLHVLGRHLGIDTVVLRYFNVFGPGQDPASEYAAVVPRFATQVLRGERPTINGTGEISRDFVFVANVVAANLLAAKPGAPSGLTCNVASGSHRTLLELLDTICDAAGRKVEPIVGPPRAGDIRDSRADIGLARQALGYEPSVSFEDGIARTVDWLRAAPQS